MHFSYQGQVYGTLHMKTFDGVEYIFHGLGEYVIVRLSSPKGNNIFTLQGQSNLMIKNSTFNTPVIFEKLAAFYQGMVMMKVSTSTVHIAICLDYLKILFQESSRFQESKDLNTWIFFR